MMSPWDEFRISRTLMWIAAATAGGAFGIFHWWGSLRVAWPWTMGIFFGACILVRLADYWRKVSNEVAFQVKSDSVVVEFISSEEAHEQTKKW